MTEINTNTDLPEAVCGETVPEKESELSGESKGRKEKRQNRTGIPFIWALIVIILTNLAWMGYIRFYYEPRWIATVSEYQTALEEKDEQITRIQIVYREREKDFEKRLTEAEENYKELSDRLRRAIDKYNKYFGLDDPVD